MRYSFISAAILALSTSVFAQTEGYNAIVLPIKDQKVAAGKPFEIVWQPGNFKTGTASITLLQGKTPETLQLGDVIATGIANSAGKYTWNVPASVVGFETYGFQISHENDPATPADESVDAAGKKIFQYSFPFHITAADGSSSSASASGTGSATVTVHIGTGPAYTPAPVPTTTASANTTSSYITSSHNATTLVQASPRPSSNLTLTTAVTTVRSTPTPTSGSQTPPAEQTANAGIANAVSGSLALIGGIAIAFAL